MRKPPRIPSHIELPFGYHIEVKYVPQTQFVEKNGHCDGAWWDESDGAGEGGVIELVKEAPAHEKYEGFLHEMQHAHVDWLEYARSRATRRGKDASSES